MLGERDTGDRALVLTQLADPAGQRVVAPHPTLTRTKHNQAKI